MLHGCKIYLHKHEQWRAVKLRQNLEFPDLEAFSKDVDNSWSSAYLQCLTSKESGSMSRLWVYLMLSAITYSWLSALIIYLYFWTSRHNLQTSGRASARVWSCRDLSHLTERIEVSGGWGLIVQVALASICWWRSEHCSVVNFSSHLWPNSSAHMTSWIFNPWWMVVAPDINATICLWALDASMSHWSGQHKVF